MTIEEAIVNHKKLKVSAEINNDMRGAFYNAEEHEQIAGWLEELSRRRVEELFRKTNEKAIRDKAIDDFVKFANDMPTVETEDGEIRPMWLEEIAERLKESEEDE